jgi:hypothetical protein
VGDAPAGATRCVRVAPHGCCIRVHRCATEQRRWWLINAGTEVDLCPKDPGFEVDLYVTCRLRIMVEIWVGLTPLDKALRAGALELTGSRTLRQQFVSWLLLSPFAHTQASAENARIRSPRPSSNHPAIADAVPHSVRRA